MATAATVASLDIQATPEFQGIRESVVVPVTLDSQVTPASQEFQVIQGSQEPNF